MNVALGEPNIILLEPRGLLLSGINMFVSSLDTDKYEVLDKRKIINSVGIEILIAYWLGNIAWLYKKLLGADVEKRVELSIVGRREEGR